MKYISLLLLVLLSGCSGLPEEFQLYQEEDETAELRDNYQPESNEGMLHTYVEVLARQLFDTASAIDLNRPLVVGTFLPAKMLDDENSAELQALGIQLQESFSTLSTQAGLRVIEFKSLSGVMITENADVMLSRDLEKLDKSLNAQYLLTGNYIEQQNSLIVNVKLINVHDKSLASAATGYIPINTLYSHSKVKLKNGLLYRGEY